MELSSLPFRERITLLAFAVVLTIGGAAFVISTPEDKVVILAVGFVLSLVLLVWCGYNWYKLSK